MTRPTRLLLIADDWEAQEVYETLLAPRFELECAPFGSVGIELAREKNPDRILLDLTFEDMHAAEAIEKLRSDPSTRSIPITVILNAGETLAGHEGRFPLEGDHVLTRPYANAALLEALS